MANLQYTVLTAVLKTSTLELLFKEELAFISKHKFLFLEKQPEIIFAINTDSVIVKQMLAVRDMMENVRKQEEQEKEQAKFDPASLTGSHRNY
jgi:hypothetical protein